MHAYQNAMCYAVRGIYYTRTHTHSCHTCMLFYTRVAEIKLSNKCREFLLLFAFKSTLFTQNFVRNGSTTPDSQQYSDSDSNVLELYLRSKLEYFVYFVYNRINKMSGVLSKAINIVKL